jgi:hypothetical protein
MARYVGLTGKQQLRLRDALNDAYDLADFTALLLDFELKFENQGGLNDPFPARILASVKSLEERGDILAFVAAVRSRNPADPAFAQIESDLKAFAAPVPATDPFEVCLLSGGHVLVNRTKLRSALKELCKATGKRILVIKDDPTIAARKELRIKTGKSHTLQMISYLDQVTGGFNFFLIDLDELGRAVRSGDQIQPYDIAEAITGYMGCKQILEEKAKDEQWARWTYNFCNKFETEAKNAQRTWIVIDSFHITLLPQDTIDLLKQIAARVNVSLTNLRLILIGYADALGPSIPVANEVLDIFGEDALIEFFARAFREKSLVPDQDKVVDKVAAVLKDLDPNQPDYVEQVCTRAIAELETL